MQDHQCDNVGLFQTLEPMSDISLVIYHLLAFYWYQNKRKSSHHRHLQAGVDPGQIEGNDMHSIQRKLT